MKKKVFMVICFALGLLSMQAQDVILPKRGNPITAYNLGVGETYYFYTLDENDESTVLRIAKDSVLMVRKADGSVLTNENVSKSAASSKKTDFPIIKDEDIHGSLIAEGNKVFIPTNSSLEYEQAGQKELKRLVEEWGYWTVVEDLEQAHFVLQFITSTSSRDFSVLAIRPRKYYRNLPYISGGEWQMAYNKQMGILAVFCWSSESPDDNKRAAMKMYTPLKKAITDSDSKEAYLFFDKAMNKALDADSKNNNFAAGGGRTIAIVLNF
jgi:hypothetical protein